MPYEGGVGDLALCLQTSYRIRFKGQRLSPGDDIISLAKVTIRLKLGHTVCLPLTDEYKLCRNVSESVMGTINQANNNNNSPCLYWINDLA